MNEAKLMIIFRGNKKEIHQQLKEICGNNGESMNRTVISLIENYLKKNK